MEPRQTHESVNHYKSCIAWKHPSYYIFTFAKTYALHIEAPKLLHFQLSQNAFTAVWSNQDRLINLSICGGL